MHRFGEAKNQEGRTTRGIFCTCQCKSSRSESGLSRKQTQGCDDVVLTDVQGVRDIGDDEQD